MKLTPVLMLVLLALALCVAVAPVEASRYKCVRYRSGCRRYGYRGRCKIKVYRGYKRRCRRRYGRRRGRRCYRVRKYRVYRGYRCKGRRRGKYYGGSKYDDDGDDYDRDDYDRPDYDRPSGAPYEPPYTPPKYPDPVLCHEKCVYGWRKARAHCNRAACYIRKCGTAHGYYSCTSGLVPRLPSNALCGSVCKRQTLYTAQRYCDSTLCKVHLCAYGPYGQYNSYSCVPKVGPVAGVPTKPPVKKPPIVPIKCASVCYSDFNTANSTCNKKVCKTIECTVAKSNPVKTGYGCVSLLSIGKPVTGPKIVQPTMSPTTTPSPTPEP